MIDAATVEGFRGLRRLEIDGFARVNVIVGKNDCGKTALMEALMIAEGADGAAGRAFFAQALRRSSNVARDFERFWRPLFWNQDAERGFSVELRGSNRAPVRVELHRSVTPRTVLIDPAAGVPAAWTIDVRIVNHEERSELIAGGPSGLSLPSLQSGGGESFWIMPSRNVGPDEIRLFSRLKQAGREAQLLNLLREIDSRISGIEILALGGTEAELFVRLEPETPLLPVSMMGDGFQRCFEIGVAAESIDGSLFIDELDNGLHYSVLDPVWRWIALISQKHDIQVFATTHSEECIHAACRAFTALNDDGLRVIRLDRREDRTTATLYDRALVETAAETGVEIRG